MPCGGTFSLKLFKAVLLFRPVLFFAVVTLTVLLLLLLMLLLFGVNNESDIGLHGVLTADTMFFIAATSPPEEPTGGLVDLLMTCALGETPSVEQAVVKAKGQEPVLADDTTTAEDDDAADELKIELTDKSSCSDFAFFTT